MTPLRAGIPANTKRLLDVVGVALPGGDSRGLLRGIVEQPAHLLGVQTGRATGRRGGAEVAGQMLCVLMWVADLESQAAPSVIVTRGADVVAERDRAQEPRTIDIELFAGRQRGGHHGRSRDAIATARANRRFHPNAPASPFANAASMAPQTTSEPTTSRPFRRMGPRELDRDAAGSKFGAGDHGGEGIEDVLLGLFDRFFGKRASAGLAHVGAQPGHDAD